MKRENILNRANTFLENIRSEVNKKCNMLKEMDPNAIADYMVKHPGTGSEYHVLQCLIELYRGQQVSSTSAEGTNSSIT
jgi:hypothetical protein